MPLLLIIIHANQKNLAGIILQAIQIILPLDLFHCLFCGMPPLQLNDQSRQIAVSIRLKHNICKAFSSRHFSVQGVVLLSRVVCKGDHAGQSVFIVVFQDRCIRLMCLFDQFGNCFRIAGKGSLQQPLRGTNCLYNWLPAAVFNGIDKLLPHFSVRIHTTRFCSS